MSDSKHAVENLLTLVVVTVVHITTWSAVELQTGLFCASAPAIKPLLRKVFPRIFTTRATNSIAYSKPSKSTHDRDGMFKRNTGDDEIELTPKDVSANESVKTKNWYDREGSDESVREGNF